MEGILNLKRLHIKYWTGTLPKIETKDPKVYYNSVITECNTLQRSHKLALEAYIKRDLSSYGLLGVEYIPALDANQLHVYITYNIQNEEIYESELATDRPKDPVYKGIPMEQTYAIYKGIEEYITKYPKLSGGILDIKVGANCEVGSSAKVFSNLIKLMIDVILRMDDDDEKWVENYIKLSLQNKIIDIK